MQDWREVKNTKFSAPTWQLTSIHNYSQGIWGLLLTSTAQAQMQCNTHILAKYLYTFKKSVLLKNSVHT